MVKSCLRLIYSILFGECVLFGPLDTGCAGGQSTGWCAMTLSFSWTKKIRWHLFLHCAFCTMCQSRGCFAKRFDCKRAVCFWLDVQENAVQYYTVQIAHRNICEGLWRHMFHLIDMSWHVRFLTNLTINAGTSCRSKVRGHRAISSHHLASPAISWTILEYMTLMTRGVYGILKYLEPSWTCASLQDPLALSRT